MISIPSAQEAWRNDAIGLSEQDNTGALLTNHDAEAHDTHAQRKVAIWSRRVEERTVVAAVVVQKRTGVGAARQGHDGHQQERSNLQESDHLVSLSVSWAVC